MIYSTQYQLAIKRTSKPDDEREIERSITHMKIELDLEKNINVTYITLQEM